MLSLILRGKKGVIKFAPFFLIVIVIFLFWNKIKDYFKRKTSGFSDKSKTEKRSFLAAQSLINAMGSGSKWYQPSSWTEDESKVIEVVNANSDILELVEKDYYDLSGQILWADINRYLSVRDFEKLQNLR